MTATIHEIDTFTCAASHKSRGFYHYPMTCPRCGNTTEVRVPAGHIKRWLCPITQGCQQWFIQVPQQYGRKPHVITVPTPGRPRLTMSDDPNKETP